MMKNNTREFQITAPGGSIYAKAWTPEGSYSQVPVILLHDSLGSVDLWRGFPEILAEKLNRQVIAYDRLGFGKSDARHEPPSLRFIEEEGEVYFPWVKSGLSIKKYVLFGHSVGGGMACNIAARDKDCQGVVTAASQAFVEDLTRQGIIKVQKGFEKPGQMERLKKWHGKKALWVLRAWTDTWLSPDFADWSLEDCMKKVFCPVLAIHGDKDEYGSRAFPEFIAGKAAGPSQMPILKDCGHMPHLEKTDEVIGAINEFLKQHGI
ncbi:alpha/beta hydrolase fold protein [Desulfatibacillum aliphaticivorans]|uniref:Alpha/beta hydrolase fold protein n=1 Tax=Desulfatibacillum aliphaticivorans TaxID=218208 RepID=B8FEA5_DESAL|nr:alpha/beta hydrolase [Desulfatibacillum aliphaticivorans]ACL06886.1 alpha/beta hydrolase fold protein [Desulfatibacillum aliphaticivorans]